MENIDDLSINPIRFSKYDKKIYSNASLSGWGVCCNGKRANGYWKENEKYLSINHLELLAAFFGLNIFGSELKNCQILLHIDNTSAIAYINRMGGVQFDNFSRVAKKLWQRCEMRKIWIFASYIESKRNAEADFELRWLELHTEIELFDSTFKNLCEGFVKPEIDLFASRKNAKCPTFVSWKKDPESIAIDAFTLPWNQLFFYAFPPSSIILRAFKK